jgi:hypothetical protein
MLTGLITLQQGRRLRHLLTRLQPVATWNLHTTQPSTFFPTYDEIVCNDPGFYQILGKFFSLLHCLRWLKFHRDLKLLSLLESFIRKTILNPLLFFLKNSLQACLQKKSLTKCFIKLLMPKVCLKSIFQKLSHKGFSLILKRNYSKSNFYLHYANKILWSFHIDFYGKLF